MEMTGDYGQQKGRHAFAQVQTYVEQKAIYKPGTRGREELEAQLPEASADIEKKVSEYNDLFSPYLNLLCTLLRYIEKNVCDDDQLFYRDIVFSLITNEMKAILFYFAFFGSNYPNLKNSIVKFGLLESFKTDFNYLEVFKKHIDERAFRYTLKHA